MAEDPVIEHFGELRKYIERSHEGLSKRLDTVEARLGSLDGGQQRLGRKVDTGFDRLERKMDAGFEQVTHKLEMLAPSRRASPRRRKE